MQIGRPTSIDAGFVADPALPVPGLPLRQGPGAVPVFDPVDIRPPGVAAVLRILIAEVLGSWELPLPASAPDTPSGAALFLVQTFLQRLPGEESDPPTLLAAHDQLLAGLVRGLGNALEIVAAWRGVSRESQDAVREARAIVFAAVGEERPDPRLGAWVMRPEWLDAAPRLERFRRRRRRARQRLLDPDLPLPDLGEDPAGPGVD